MQHWMKGILTLVGIAAVAGSALAGATVARPGDDLQAVLDRGDDLALLTGQVYLISEALQYKTPGQRIYTADVRYPSEFATLRLGDRELTQLITAGGVEGAVLEHVICDGRRYEFGIPPKEETGGGAELSLVLFGAPGGDNQIVRECVFLNARSWSTVKVHEGASRVRVENNFIFGAGADCRGNGREANEDRIKWGDGITFAARDSLVRNNLIIDPTDVGFVLFGAPGTIAEDNVVVAISRESLGGANLVDPIDYYKLSDTETDYRGLKVRNNLVEAFGSRIHIGYPMGAAPWVPRKKGQILVGGEVTGNTMAGGAGAYGFVVHGVRDWKATGNTSSALYSGIADGLSPKNRAHEPSPFVYDPATVENVELQEEFVTCVPHIEHLLRCNHGPKDARGYRIYPYGDAEASAVVEAAYLEMLGRPVNEDDMKSCVGLLQANTLNADGLRRRLMSSTEFRNRFGYVAPEDLHPYRTQLWFGICDSIIRDALNKKDNWPSASGLYKDALNALYFERRETLKMGQLDKSAMKRNVIIDY
jgi:hypothetical protein